MDVGGSGSAELRSSIKKWKIIYPVYLNSKKTVAEGRRIAITKACPDPTCIEIADSCAYLKIPCAIEVPLSFFPSYHWKFCSGGFPLFFQRFIILALMFGVLMVYMQLDKAYPRDFFQVGRVRVQLVNDDGTPVNPAIKTSKP
jgi:signal recognition particle subunit SRP19